MGNRVNPVNEIAGRHISVRKLQAIMNIWQKLRTRVRLAAIGRALGRPAPNEIPLSGNRLIERNYYTVALGSVHDGWRFTVQSIVSQGLDGAWHEGGFGPGLPASFPKASLSQCPLQISYYVRELQISYTSAVKFLVHQLTFYPWFQVWRERASQFFFNRQKLVRGDRITVLRVLLSQTLGNHAFRVDSGGLMGLIYGDRWAGHPDNEQLYHYYVLVLDSLVGSGDLNVENNVYHLSPKALSTLAQFEEDNRKHGDLVTLQKIIAVLTFALVMVGIIQAIAIYFSSKT